MYNEKRKRVVNVAQSFLGCNEKDGSHKKIIDIYNQRRPLPRGYAVQYDDYWCATYVSSVAIISECTDIIPVECSCAQMIKLCKNMEIWQEDDSYEPLVGDLIFYDWNDDGIGDCMGNPDHVGYIVRVDNLNMLVIEGNYNGEVKYRTITINDKNIRGYGVPRYKDMENKHGFERREYVVSKGDTLFSIAAQFNQDVEGLARYNNISNPDLIYVGQTIYIPGNGKRIVYTVREGDTLSQIALKYNTTISKLANLNDIKNPHMIYIGQRIEIFVE